MGEEVLRYCIHTPREWGYLFIFKTIFMNHQYICKCSNCGNIMYDENPHPNSNPVDVSHVTIPIWSMELLNDNGDSYNGCGECQTDEYLMDISNQEELTEYLKLLL